MYLIVNIILNNFTLENKTLNKNVFQPIFPNPAEIGSHESKSQCYFHHFNLAIIIFVTLLISIYTFNNIHSLTSRKRFTEANRYGNRKSYVIHSNRRLIDVVVIPLAIREEATRMPPQLTVVLSIFSRTHVIERTTSEAFFIRLRDGSFSEMGQNLIEM